MPKVSIEFTPEEVVSFFEKMGPLQGELVKALWKLAADNPEMAEQLGAMQAAYYKGATQELLGRREAAPVWPMMAMFNQWVALMKPKT